MNNDTTGTHLPSIIAVRALAFIQRPGVSPRLRLSVFVQYVFDVTYPFFSWSASGSVTWSQIIIYVGWELAVFHSHKMAKLLYLLSLDVLNAWLIN